MRQQGKRAALGIALAVILFGAGSFLLQSRATSDMQSRTPSDVAALGPQVGEQVPEVSLPDQNGEMRSLESISGPKGAMLLFHRSADW